jgi:hypothetical protein
MLVGNHETNPHFTDQGVAGRIILKWISKKGVTGCGQDTCESGQESETGSSAPARVSSVLRSIEVANDPVTEDSFDFNTGPHPVTDRYKDIYLRTSENSHPSKSYLKRSTAA